MGVKLGRNLFVLPLVYLISAFVGVLVGVKLLLEIFREGKEKVLAFKQREKPAALTDDRYGKHCYINLPRLVQGCAQAKSLEAVRSASNDLASNDVCSPGLDVVYIIKMLMRLVEKGRNIKLHYVIGGDAGKPVILFLHGFPQCWYTWRHQITNLAKDYRTVAVDLRGFGESDKPWNPLRYDLDEVADDIRALIDTLGCGSCVLVGHGLGAQVAWVMGVRHPQVLEKIIIMNTPHVSGLWELANIDPIYTSRIMWRFFLYLVPVLPQLYLRARDFDQLIQLMTGSDVGAKPDTYTEQDIEVYKYTYQRPDVLSAALLYYKAAVLCHLPLYRTHRSSVPTLMIWGARQQMLPKEAAVVTKKRVEHYSITGTLSGSYWLHEEEPGVVNEYIREYIETGKVENLAKKGDIYEITKGFAN